jgi:hypothetical protein
MDRVVRAFEACGDNADAGADDTDDNRHDQARTNRDWHDH